MRNEVTLELEEKVVAMMLKVGEKEKRDDARLIIKVSFREVCDELNYEMPSRIIRQTLGVLKKSKRIAQLRRDGVPFDGDIRYYEISDKGMALMKRNHAMDLIKKAKGLVEEKRQKLELLVAGRSSSKKKQEIEDLESEVEVFSGLISLVAKKYK